MKLLYFHNTFKFKCILYTLFSQPLHELESTLPFDNEETEAQAGYYDLLKVIQLWPKSRENICPGVSKTVSVYFYSNSIIISNISFTLQSFLIWR